MSMDLLNRLIADILQVTETLMSTDSTDLQAYQPAAPNSVEKQHGSKGLTHRNKHHAKAPMSQGVHRSVC
jgi:glutamate decarboxylase